MKNTRVYILVAIVFVALTAFCFDALAAPNVPTMQTNKPFVLRDTADNETDYSTLSEAMNALKDKSGSFTLYLMRDYDASNEETVYQTGDYNLLVRSGQENEIFTLTNKKDFHFKLDDTITNTYNDIVLDGGANDENNEAGGGLFLQSEAKATIGKGCTMQRCSARIDEDYNKYFPISPITLEDENTKLIIKDAKIINNYCPHKDGMGIIEVSSNATVQIFNSLVEKNICSGLMTAPVIRMRQNGLLEIKNSKFIGNQAIYGGVIANYGSNLYISDSEFTSNISSSGGAIYYSIGPIFNLKNCTFTNNIGGGHGGAIYAKYCEQLKIDNCVFDSNLTGNWGGAIHFEDVEDAKINNCNFTNNSAYSQGGALNIYSSKVSISNSTLSNNGTTGEIDGLKIHPILGGAIFVSSGDSLDIQNCELTGNSAKYHGGAIFAYNYSGMSGGYDEEQKNEYSNITIDDKTIFENNITTLCGYSLPPKNYKELSNLKFNRNSFTGKGYPNVLKLDKSLLNNYDINYECPGFAYMFDANGGKFSDGSSKRVTDYLSPGEVYTIFSDVPQKGSSEFLGWKDENSYFMFSEDDYGNIIFWEEKDDVLYQPEDPLPYTYPTRNRVFKAKWKE